MQPKTELFLVFCINIGALWRAVIRIYNRHCISSPYLKIAAFCVPCITT